jgi:hypothetical protein
LGRRTLHQSRGQVLERGQALLAISEQSVALIPRRRGESASVIENLDVSPTD